MVTKEYSEAAVEVLGIIDSLEEEEQNKIPKEIIKFLEDNQSQTYNPDIDYFEEDTEKLKKQLKEKTKQILAGIYLDYLCNEEEKEEYKKVLLENEAKYQEEISKKYDTDLFKNRKEDKGAKPTAIVVKKENLITRIITKIKTILKIK